MMLLCRYKCRLGLFLFLFLNIFLICETRSEKIAGKPPTVSAWESDEFWLNEKTTLSLTCPADLSGELNYQWFHNGNRLDAIGSVLRVESLSLRDVGQYRCSAGNIYGTVLSPPVDVNVLYITGFNSAVENITRVSSGVGFVLQPPSVISSSHLNFTWRWFYNDDEIESSETPYITAFGDLVVLDSSEHFGTYKVEVSAGGNRFVSPNYIVNEETQDVSVMDFLYSPKDAVYRVNDKVPVVFECVPNQRGRLVSVTWFLDGGELRNDQYVKISHWRRRLYLYSPHLLTNKDTVGVTCKAYNRQTKSVSADARLDIFRRPLIERLKFANVITRNLGDSLELKCPALGVPEPELHWYFNGKDIKAEGHLLRLGPIDGGHLGVYQCEAINKAGADMASIWLKTDYNLAPADAPPINNSAVSFLERPQDAVVDLGKEIVLRCRASGEPSPSIVWKHNGTTVFPNEKFSIDDGSLTVLSASSMDSGVYLCVASNDYAKAEATALVQVIGSNLIDYGPSNQSILIGSNIIMPCKISDEYINKEGVQVEWTWQSRTIPPTGDAVHRFVINSDHSLQIKQVGPDNIGLYTCTANFNGKAQSVSAWLRIIEKPSMPKAVYAELVNDTIPARVRVTWREGFDGNSPLIKHIVEMRSMGPTGLWSDWEVALDNVPTELCCSALIDNLKPSATIEFRVVAVNRHGPGKPSLPSNNITMPQQPPAAAPRNVAASARSWSSIMVQWQPPPPEQWNGDILGYIIRYRLANYASLPWLEKNVSNGHARNAPLEHLITWREYEIQIAAYNHRGMGVFSKPLYVTTLEGIPSQAPHSVKVGVLNSSAIVVSFTPPDQQMIPGVNQGYKIELWKGEVSPSALYRQIRVLPDEANISEVISGLEKFGHYNVTVLCFTSPGDGPRSDPVEVVTMQDLPGAVESVRFETVLFNSVNVAWDPPSERNGIITKYTIRYWEDGTSDIKTLEAGPDDRNATIEGLTASTHYTIDVQASTEVGPGPRTEAKFESGVPPELPGRPSSLVISDIGARNVMLQFVPGFDGHTLIRKWIVEAKLSTSSIFSSVFEISAPKARSFTVEGLRPFTKYQLRLIAENVRGRGGPSEPSRQFETKQAEPEIAPERLFAEPLSATSISIVWTPLHTTQWNGDPRGYLIMFRPANNSKQWNEIRASNVKAGDFVLSDLRPYTTYEIRIVAENSLGRSKTSDPVIATTYESVPSGAPVDVHAVVDDHKRAVVVWKSVDSELSNGVIIGYQVRLVPEEERLRGEFTRMVDIPDAGIFNTSFSQLRPFTVYRVFIAAYTIVGPGPHSSSPPLIQTAEDTPGEPSHVAFSFVSENEVRLKWLPPLNPNGRIQHYEIAYWRPGSKEDVMKIQLPYNIYGFSATGLQRNTQYLFGVSAETSVGWGPQSVVAVVTTSQRLPPPVPPAPQRNDARPRSATEIALKWNKPVLPEGEIDISPVRFIDVEYQTSNNEWTQFANTIPGTRNEAIIIGLRPNTAYRARIRWSSDFGQSGWSVESAWIKTLEAAPSSPPVSLQASPYESSSLLLQWQPPPPSDWNADMIGYRILYRIYLSNETFKYDEIPPSQEEHAKMQHIIRRLASFRHYIVQVQSFNEQGSSMPSSPVIVYVGYSIPKQKIANIVAEAVSPTSIAVSWDPWVNHPDDVISGFRIRYSPILPVLSGEENLEEIVVSENNTVALTELRKYTEYQISVSAYNRAGEGEVSAVRVRTLEDCPGPVSDLVFSDILLDSVNVSWSPPAHPNGRIQAYIVNYRTYKLREEFKKEIQEKTVLTYHLASNLEENVTYFFSVRAETSAGYGSEVTGNVTVGPNPGCPEPPSKPHLIPGQTSVTLEWQDGHPGTSSIKGHIIQAKRIARANDVFHDSKDVQERNKRSGTANTGIRPQHVLGEWVTLSSVLGSQPHYEVSYRQLEPASLYVFRLFARNTLGIGFASPESDQLHVPASLPEDPFFTKWWFIVMVALVTFVVIVIVVALLCVTGNHYKYEKRNSIDSLQLADGGIVSYELRASKRRDVHQARQDMPVRPNTNTSWISDSREPPAYGSIVAMEGVGTTNMYGSLATDVIPQSGRGSTLINMGFARPLSAGNYTNQDPMLDDFSADGESIDGVSDQEEAEPSIAQHYEHEDTYRNTWRRARAEALAEANPPSVPLSRPPRPASSDSNRSELTMITSPRTNAGSTSLINGFSSFV